ncbi:MAG: efflux transporter outer membrane subunit [Acidobacteriota bacterium]
MRRLLSLGGLVLLAACTVGPDYQPPVVDSIPDEFRYAPAATASVVAEVRDRWWSIFDDALLDSILLEVRSANRELQAAVARLDATRAAIGLARADGLPAVSLEPSVIRQSLSENAQTFGGSGDDNLDAFAPDLDFTTYALPVQASWEIDVVGRVRRSVEAAVADVEAAEADVADLLLLLEADAAELYFSIRAFDLEIELLEATAEARKEGLELVETRFELGVVDELDVAQARTQLATAEAAALGVRRQRIAAETALAALAGKTATRFVVAPLPLEGEPPSVPAGLPSELLRARPDVRSAERSIASANARVGIAEAAFYPSVTLVGSGGFSALDESRWIESDSVFWSIGPQVYLPIFQGGRLDADLEAAQARYEASLLDYQAVVLRSFAEVENRLAASELIEAQLLVQGEAVNAADRALELANIKYRGGISDYLTVLDSERTKLDVERQQAQLRGQAYINTVRLVRALGGRW